MPVHSPLPWQTSHHIASLTVRRDGLEGHDEQILPIQGDCGTGALEPQFPEAVSLPVCDLPGLDHDGLYRIPHVSSLIRLLARSFVRGDDIDLVLSID